MFLSPIVVPPHPSRTEVGGPPVMVPPAGSGTPLAAPVERLRRGHTS
jgi:hypothetical protein